MVVAGAVNRSEKERGGGARGRVSVAGGPGRVIASLALALALPAPPRQLIFASVRSVSPPRTYGMGAVRVHRPAANRGDRRPRTATGLCLSSWKSG